MIDDRADDLADDLVAALSDVHRRTTMVGWDFAVLAGSTTSDDPPWDFEADSLDALRRARRAVDLGTGGGERLSALLDRLPAGCAPSVVATEGWEPNEPVARERLTPYGVPVVAYDAEAEPSLPFADGSVDLLMARHESYDAAEVARVLAPGGVFLTQQVDGRDTAELRDWFGGEALYPDVRLDRARPDLERAGLTVDVADEWRGRLRFADVEAVVTYLALTPWTVPGFDPADHAERLAELHRAGPVDVTQVRFRCSARKA
ncbi:class I SAM-dependent methyltransferase [Isoptericola sp. NPDC019693]|uniref:class I SAM-dependent methyltransferase n=1 Tax=Isoptericola sp. NPDC019693 TaxID=3364009 RepID=UPI00379C49FD